MSVYSTSFIFKKLSAGLGWGIWRRVCCSSRPGRRTWMCIMASWVCKPLISSIIVSQNKLHNYTLRRYAQLNRQGLYRVRVWNECILRVIGLLYLCCANLYFIVAVESTDNLVPYFFEEYKFFVNLSRIFQQVWGALQATYCKGKDNINVPWRVIFWVVIPYSMVKVHWLFRRTCELHLQSQSLS